MHTVSQKVQGAVVGMCSPLSSLMSWGNGAGSQMTNAGSYNLLTACFVDRSNALDASLKEAAAQSQQLQVLAQLQQPGSGGVNKGMTKMQLSPTKSGYGVTIANGQHHQPHVASTLHSTSPEYHVPRTQLELGHSIAHVTYPCADPYFGAIVDAYGDHVMNHPQILGFHQGRMPLPSDVIEDEPVYVNAKQYRGILRRRQSRAKAELGNKFIKVRKPYLHESRHLHAMRRARGCGGRFLNTKLLETKKVNADDGKLTDGQHAQTVSSSSTEALHSENGNMNSSEVHGNSGLSGSEVTSMSESCPDGTGYSYNQGNGGYLSHFHLLGFSPLSDGSGEVESGQGMGYSIKWVAADNCCDPMKV